MRASILAFSLVLAGTAYADVDRYSVRSEAHELEVNETGEVRFILEAVGEHTFDGQYPVELKLTVEASEKVLALSKSRLGRAEATYDKNGKSITWKVSAIARKPGSFPVRANMKFRVCEEDDDCFDQTAELKVTLIAKE